MNANVAVLGGGVAGVVVANELATQGVEVDLIERAPRLGGLHRSVVKDGMVFDIGAFAFNERHEMIRSFPFLLNSFKRVRPSITSITPKGNLDQYPMTPRGYVRDHGVVSLGVSVADLIVAKARYRRRDTVPSFAKFYMGERIYRSSGLKDYIERLYGLPDEEVGIEFALQRLGVIRSFTPAGIARRLARRSWDRIAGRVSHDSYALVRPPEGFDRVYQLIGDHLEQAGVNIHLNCNVRSIRCTPVGFDLDFGDHVKMYDRVVSTIPIPVAQRLIGLEPGMKFDSMSLYSIFYSGHLRHQAAMQHNFTPHGRWKRLTAFSQYYGRHEGRDYWTVEVTTKDTSPRMLEELRRDFEDHARELGLFEGELTHVGDHITERAYPVFHRGDSQRMEAERARLSQYGIDFVGRQGAFEYLTSHGTATKAKELAARMSIGGETHAVRLAGPSSRGEL